MKEYKFRLSENDWEYTGHITIIANKIERVNDKTLIADGVKIEFDEPIDGFTDSKGD